MKLFHQQHFDRSSILQKGEYEACIFNNCDFSDQSLKEISFISCEFTDCNLSNAQIHNTSFQDILFTRCKLMGLRFDLCNPFSLELHFKDCTLDFSSFTKCNLKNTKFVKTSLVGIDFTESNLTGIYFDECNLLNTIFYQTLLDRSDFTSAVNFNINPEQNKLKKTKFSTNGLKGLLTGYDIIIK
ncbi:MAG TPA: pentapeptide repeat-containing protein, partial [Flavobacterium sp.]|nr:pentapeptide repeat-containing protein [Flavobacterium sp.]